LRVSAADVRRARIAGRAQRAPQIRTASFLEVALAPIRLVPEQCAHMVLARGPGIRQRVAPGPVRGPSVALRSSVDGNGLRILGCGGRVAPESSARSEEHTSELQSRGHLVCRLLLEKKKTRQR